MKNITRLLTGTMLLCCMALIAQNTQEPKPEKVDEKPCGGWLKKCDSNGNGKITCAEARACGLKTPIKKDHPAYNCMIDRDGDGQVCE